jgi:hypothetical protein
MILTSIWYPIETVALTALSNLSAKRHSLMDDTLESSPLRYQFFCPGVWLRRLNPTCIQSSRRPLGRLRSSCSCYVLRYRVIGNSSCADPKIGRLLGNKWKSLDAPTILPAKDMGTRRTPRLCPRGSGRDQGCGLDKAQPTRSSTSGCRLTQPAMKGHRIATLRPLSRINRNTPAANVEPSP